MKLFYNPNEAFLQPCVGVRRHRVVTRMNTQE
jgi:hypothetical protein